MTSVWCVCGGDKPEVEGGEERERPQAQTETRRRRRVQTDLPEGEREERFSLYKQMLSIYLHLLLQHENRFNKVGRVTHARSRDCRLVSEVSELEMDLPPAGPRAFRLPKKRCARERER